MKFTSEPWECGERILCLNGKPIGSTWASSEADSIADFCNAYISPLIQEAYDKGVKDTEILVNKALGGHIDSQLWGDNGLIAATMRCVKKVQEEEK